MDTNIKNLALSKKTGISKSRHTLKSNQLGLQQKLLDIHSLENDGQTSKPILSSSYKTPRTHILRPSLKTRKNTIASNNILLEGLEAFKAFKAIKPLKKLRKRKMRFFSVSKLVYNKKRLPLVPDPIIEFLEDYSYDLMRGKPLSGKNISQILYNQESNSCICENLKKYHSKLEAGCKCYDMVDYENDSDSGKQGNSSASNKSIICLTSVANATNKQLATHSLMQPLPDNQSKLKTKKKEKMKPDTEEDEYILKLIPNTENYIIKRKETHKNIYLEMNEFILEMIIHRYLQNSLPLNVARLLQSGVCNSSGYHLLEYAVIGNARTFITNLMRGTYDNEFEINDEDKRYQVFINCLLQVIFTLGHLQTSELAFFHGDCKPENFLVTRLDTSKYPVFIYIINARKIEIRNLGFVIQIANFSGSSISLHSSSISRKYLRCVSELKYKRILGSYVDKIIDTFDNHHSSALLIGDIKVGNLLSNFLLPKSIDAFITVIRSAGVAAFRTIDLYVFLLTLMNTEEMLEYCMKHKLYMTVMGFMSNAFLDEVFILKPKSRTTNEAVYEIHNIFKKIKEPMRPIFTDNYFATLELLNLYLIKPPGHIE